MLRPAVPLSIVLALSLTACNVGDLSGPGGGGGADAGAGDPGADAGPDSPDAIPPNYTLAVTPPSIDTILGTEAVFTVELSSMNFTGATTLSAIGVPDSWTVAFDPPVVNVPLDSVAYATMTVTIPTNGEAVASMLQVEAVAAPGTRSTLASVAVANEVVVTLPAATGGGAHPFPAPLDIRLGAQVTIANADTTLHRIHSDNGNRGFPHQEGEMGEGGSYSFTITQTGSYDFYCHIHEVNAGVGRIAVTEP